jgi:hypothetical protein
MKRDLYAAFLAARFDLEVVREGRGEVLDGWLVERANGVPLVAVARRVAGTAP